MNGGAAPKRKGDQWERRVRDYFRARGYECERAYGAGRADDVGDLLLAAWPFLIDCKAVARSTRAEWLDALRTKAANLVPLVVERRRNRDVGRAYVTVELSEFVDFLDGVRRLVDANGGRFRL